MLCYPFYNCRYISVFACERKSHEQKFPINFPSFRLKALKPIFIALWVPSYKYIFMIHRDENVHDDGAHKHTHLVAWHKKSTISKPKDIL
jgi:hypothetical protein